jgi:hypothetical protein
MSYSVVFSAGSDNLLMYDNVEQWVPSKIENSQNGDSYAGSDVVTAKVGEHRRRPTRYGCSDVLLAAALPSIREDCNFFGLCTADYTLSTFQILALGLFFPMSSSAWIPLSSPTY